MWASRPRGAGAGEVLRAVLAVARCVDAWAMDRSDTRGENSERACEIGGDEGSHSRCRAECVRFGGGFAWWLC